MSGHSEPVSLAGRRLTDHEGPGPPPGEEHAGAATPALSLTVVPGHSVHRPGTRRGVGVHLFSSQQVDVVLERVTELHLTQADS